MELHSGHLARRVRIFRKRNRSVCGRTAFDDIVAGEVRPTYDVQGSVRSGRTDTDVPVRTDMKPGNIGRTEVRDGFGRSSVRDVHSEAEISGIRTLDPSGVVRIGDASLNF